MGPAVRMPIGRWASYGRRVDAEGRRRVDADGRCVDADGRPVNVLNNILSVMQIFILSAGIFRLEWKS